MSSISLVNVPAMGFHHKLSSCLLAPLTEHPISISTPGPTCNLKSHRLWWYLLARPTLSYTVGGSLRFASNLRGPADSTSGWWHRAKQVMRWRLV